MTASRKLTITIAGTVTAVLAAGGIAMATPAATELPGPATSTPATGMMDGQAERATDGDGPQAGGMGQMHADRWTDGDADAMHRQMGEMHGQGEMHGDAEQMQQHHDRMVERNPQMQQRHDDMVDRYPEMREHMGTAATLRGPGR